MLISFRRRFSKLKQIYEKTIKDKGMNRDPYQLQAIEILDKLNDELINKHPIWKRYADGLQSQETSPSQQYFKKQVPIRQKEQSKSSFFSFFSRDFSTTTTYDCSVKGLYLYGGSGCGKSFISDLFYDQLLIKEKKKVHFHQFMAQIHSQLFQLQRQKKGYDPLAQVAINTSKKTRLLYLDEFQVTDVADASILKRLFQRLFNNELVLLATSNRHPTNLYKSGHQRQFFLPFIDFLTERCTVKHLNSHKDYRYDMEKDNDPLDVSYLTPIDEVSQNQLTQITSLLTNEKQPKFTPLIIEPIPGRKLTVPRSNNKVCIYQFQQLFDNVIGQSDFRAICKQFKAIIIKNMRIIKRNQTNMANRLIKLFDEAYFRNVKIYINASVGVNQIIQIVSQKEAATEQDFALNRCKSRLMEFQTKQYKERLSYIQANPQSKVERQQPK